VKIMKKTNIIKKLLAAALAAVFAAAFAAPLPFGCTAKAAAGRGTLVVAGGTLTQAQTEGYDNISISGAVTFDSVTFTALSGSAVRVSGSAAVTIQGSCSFTGAAGGAGIEVPQGSSLTLTGTGSLRAMGNGGADSRTTGGSGIGGTTASASNGIINIDGLSHLTAIGFGHWASGIGSCSGSNAGGITINNSVIDLAEGGYVRRNITVKYGKSDPEGGPAIGGGSAGGSAGKITITNSQIIKAAGGSKAAAIGAGYWGGADSITVTGSRLDDITGGCTAAGIGLSRVDRGSASKSALITITGSAVNVTGGDYGAAIGSGYNADSLKGGLGTVAVVISGGEISACGGMGGAGIGGGYKGHNVNVTIKDSAAVNAVGGVLGETFDKGKTAGETAGASAIGTGANGSGEFTGGTIAIEAGCSITAASNGDKWAIDTDNCDTLSVTASLIQARFERGYGSLVRTPSAETGVTLDASASNSVSIGGAAVTLPAGYYCAAATASAGANVSSAKYSPAYASRLSSDTAGPVLASATASFACAAGINNGDYCAFRPSAQPAVYKISFAGYDGGAISSAAYLYGAAVKVPSVPQRIRAGKNVSIFAGWSTDGVTVLANIPSVTQGAAYKAVYKAEAAPADIADDPAPAAAELQAVPLPAAAGNSTAAVTAANESAPLAPVPQTGDAAAQAAALLALTALGALVTVLAAAKKRG
jgi:hypothetical protein